MHCLLKSETFDWLLKKGVPEDPYHGDTSPRYYLQFHAPAEYRRLDAFSRQYFCKIIPDAESLVHITDWVFYTESEMIAIDAIRKVHQETRRLIDAPGHCIAAEESELGISLFSLSASFAWKSYLYCPHQRSTLYNWDGEIFDFWTDGEAEFEEMKSMLLEFKLLETTGAQDAAPNP